MDIWWWVMTSPCNTWSRIQWFKQENNSAWTQSTDVISFSLVLSIFFSNKKWKDVTSLPPFDSHAFTFIIRREKNTRKLKESSLAHSLNVFDWLKPLDLKVTISHPFSLPTPTTTSSLQPQVVKMFPQLVSRDCLGLVKGFPCCFWWCSLLFALCSLLCSQCPFQ